MRQVLFLLPLLINSLSCKTGLQNADIEKEMKLEVQKSKAIKLKFNQESENALHFFQFDLSSLIASTFVPQFQKIIRNTFKDKEADQKELKTLPFYSQLTKYFPESLLKRVRYVVVDKFPSAGTFIRNTGISPRQLRQFGVDISDDFLNFTAAAMTIGDKIYIEKNEMTASTFFHECVHVVQYDQLGVNRFLTNYAQDFMSGVDYPDLPYERTAYFLQGYFEKNYVFDVTEYIREVLKDEQNS